MPRARLKVYLLVLQIVLLIFLVILAVMLDDFNYLVPCSRIRPLKPELVLIRLRVSDVLQCLLTLG